MQSNRLLSFLGATAALVVITMLISANYSSDTELKFSRSSIDPDWVAKQPLVVSIELSSPAGSWNLHRDGDQWLVDDRFNYAADNSKIWALVSFFGELELLEKRTDNPRLHQKLNLQARDVIGAASTQVTMKDAAGEPLASILMGKNRKIAGRGERQFYLRHTNSNQTWIAAGGFNPATQASAWLSREILDIDQHRIHKVTIQHPGNPEIIVSRSNALDEFQLQGVPDGRSAKTTEVAAIPFGLQKLPMVDVNKAADADLNWDQAIKVTFTTFEGLSVRVDIQRKDLGIVGRFHASTDQNRTDQSSAEAETLNQALQPWVFVLPNHTVTTFTRNFDELLMALPAAPE